MIEIIVVLILILLILYKKDNILENFSYTKLREVKPIVMDDENKKKYNIYTNDFKNDFTLEDYKNWLEYNKNDLKNNIDIYNYELYKSNELTEENLIHKIKNTVKQENKNILLENRAYNKDNDKYIKFDSFYKYSSLLPKELNDFVDENNEYITTQNIY